MMGTVLSSMTYLQLNTRYPVLTTPSNASVHGELAEPYIYTRTCHPELEALRVAGVM